MLVWMQKGEFVEHRVCASVYVYRLPIMFIVKIGCIECLGGEHWRGRVAMFMEENCTDNCVLRWLAGH